MSAHRTLEERLPPALVVGEVVRLEPEGEAYTVERVSPCAAYLRLRYLVPRRVRIEERDGTVREFTATSGGALIAVGVHSSVYRTPSECGKAGE